MAWYKNTVLKVITNPTDLRQQFCGRDVFDCAQSDCKIREGHLLDQSSWAKWGCALLPRCHGKDSTILKLLSPINKVIVRSCVGDQHVKRISSNEVNITSRARQQVKHVVVCHISSKLHGLGGGAPGGDPHGQGGREAEVGKSGRVDHQPEGQGEHLRTYPLFWSWDFKFPSNTFTSSCFQHFFSPGCRHHYRLSCFVPSHLILSLLVSQ